MALYDEGEPCTIILILCYASEDGTQYTNQAVLNTYSQNIGFAT